MTDDLLTIYGWRGYNKVMTIEQNLRNAIGLKLGDGIGGIMKLIIARQMLGSSFGPIV